MAGTGQEPPFRNLWGVLPAREAKCPHDPPIGRRPSDPPTTPPPAAPSSSGAAAKRQSPPFRGEHWGSSRYTHGHPISAADPRIELVDLARHLCRREPVDESAWVEKGCVEFLGPGLDDPRCARPGAYRLLGHLAALLLGLTDRQSLPPELREGSTSRNKPRPRQSCHSAPSLSRYCGRAFRWNVALRRSRTRAPHRRPD